MHGIGRLQLPRRLLSLLEPVRLATALKVLVPQQMLPLAGGLRRNRVRTAGGTALAELPVREHRDAEGPEPAALPGLGGILEAPAESGRLKRVGLAVFGWGGGASTLQTTSLPLELSQHLR